ncbi:MAG: hypothetical protein HYU42_06840 [Candidatus Rokubacteria bacterium]|nr:hypothetical protein [Candidatus Rokubacteria bacterium]
MPRRSAGSVPSDLFDLVVKNALDFLKQSLRELRKRPKYSVIDFCSALELLLKARLMLEHWALIISASNCDWCGALSAGLGEYSYLDGCVVCGGRFDSESFHRE